MGGSNRSEPPSLPQQVPPRVTRTRGLLHVVEVGGRDQLLSLGNDAIDSPPVVPVPLEVEDVANLVARAQQQVDVRFGV